MDRTLQDKALFEILTTADAIAAKKDKDDAKQIANELGVTLFKMGVKASEAKVLFEIARERLFDIDKDTEIILMGIPDNMAENGDA